MKTLLTWLFGHPSAKDIPCCKELIEAAFAGLYPTDQQLEKLLDYLERTP